MTTTACTDEVSVPDMVARGLDRTEQARSRALAASDASPDRRAAHLARVAELYGREARWWWVLANWAYTRGGTLPEVFGHAAILARGRALGFAEKYHEFAASARRRAALDGVGVVA